MKHAIAISKQKVRSSIVDYARMDVVEQLRRSFADIRAGRIKKFNP